MESRPANIELVDSVGTHNPMSTERAKSVHTTTEGAGPSNSIPATPLRHVAQAGASYDSVGTNSQFNNMSMNSVLARALSRGRADSLSEAFPNVTIAAPKLMSWTEFKSSFANFVRTFSLRDFTARNFTFFRLHFSYFVLIGLVGGIMIYLIEEQKGTTLNDISIANQRHL
jgi:hypothetical protein